MKIESKVSKHNSGVEIMMTKDLEEIMRTQNDNRFLKTISHKDVMMMMFKNGIKRLKEEE